MTRTSTPTLPTQVDPPRVVLLDLPAGADATADPLAAALPAGLLDGVQVVALPVLPAAARAADDTAGPDDEAEAAPEGPAPLLGPGAEALGARLGLDLLAVLEAYDVTGRVGQVVRVPLLDPVGTDGPQLLLLVGVGAAGVDDLRGAGAALARAVRGRDVVLTTVPAAGDDAGLAAFATGLTLASFVFHWRSEGPAHQPVREVRVVATAPGADDAAVDTARAALERSLAVARASWRARFLASVPAHVKNPPWLAEQARVLADEAGLEVTVWDERKLAEEGFGGILGVGQASATPPRLIRLDYTPAGAKRGTPRVVLVGKGITFDTGGLSIKPAEGMRTMKRDMTGGGVVMATLGALAAVGCPVRVTGLVAAAENAVSGNALRPGDVIRHHGGRTTEVTNTDAEGRLVMADALAYAAAELAPAALVDVATLTGAVKVALGLRTGGLFADDEGLAALLAEAASVSGEALWRLPLAEVYEDKLASPVADADNAPGGPGAITAALFLRHFTGGVPWAHLDIASVGDSGSETGEWTTGPTGFGVRLLLAWLGTPDPLAGVRPR